MNAPPIKGMPSLTILQGDSVEMLKTLPDESVQCCVTSPPYFGLRDYGVAGQIGMEKTPQLYVAALTEICSEVKRVLKPEGTFWLNLGDSYASNSKTVGLGGSAKQNSNRGAVCYLRNGSSGIPEKNLLGIPWRVAFALQAAGWYLRSDIIWAKPNPMPESVLDRPTRSHEYIFLLTKSERYFYDHEAIKEPCIYDVDGTEKVNEIRPGGYKNSVNFEGKNNGNEKQRGHSRRHDGFNDRWDAMGKDEQCTGMRNKRDVWNIAPANYPEAHFATFPPDLIKPCILAGSRPGDTVLDPFFGSGTTGLVALEFGRSCIGIELNPDYIELARQRCHVTPGLALK